MLTQGQVATPSATAMADGTQPVLLAGRSAEAIVADLHGRWYTAAREGNLFLASTAAAGTTIPASNATAATFMIYNPIGSGKNIELVRWVGGVNNATLVVSSLLLGLASGLLVAPTGITQVTKRAALLGGNASPVAVVASVATIVATTDFYVMSGVGATSGVPSDIRHEFDGALVLGPGSLAHVCGTAAQSQAWAQTLVWAEWPATA